MFNILIWQHMAQRWRFMEKLILDSRMSIFFVILNILDLASILTVGCPPIHCPELDGARETEF